MKRSPARATRTLVDMTWLLIIGCILSVALIAVSLLIVWAAGRNSNRGGFEF